METFSVRGGLIHHVEAAPFVTIPYGLGNGWTQGRGDNSRQSAVGSRQSAVGSQQSAVGGGWCGQQTSAGEA